VLQHNGKVQFPGHKPATWTMYGGSVVTFEIWKGMDASNGAPAC